MAQSISGSRNARCAIWGNRPATRARSSRCVAGREWHETSYKSTWRALCVYGHFPAGGGEALDDVQRLYDFIKLHNPEAAAKVVQKLARVPQMLLEHPRIGEQLFRFYPREVRRLLVDAYEIRYEIQNDDIYILRIWHSREARP